MTIKDNKTPNKYNYAFMALGEELTKAFNNIGVLEGINGLLGGFDSISSAIAQTPSVSNVVSRRIGLQPNSYPLGGALMLAGLATKAIGNTIAGAKMADTTDLENDINDAANAQVVASSTNDLLAQWNNHKNIDYISSDDLKSQAASSGLFGALGSLFTSGARGRKANEINAQIDQANAQQAANFSQEAQNLNSTAIDNMLKYYSAFGGPLNVMGFGGPINGFGDFTNNVTIMKNGGSHEENPYGGEQVGIAPDGNPNLIEEGEAVYNNYVFSKRLIIPDKVKKDLHIKQDNFADAFIKFQEDSEKRPNDPIAKRGLDNFALKLMQAQENVRIKKGIIPNDGAPNQMVNIAANGGHLFSGLEEALVTAKSALPEIPRATIPIGINPTLASHTIDWTPEPTYGLDYEDSEPISDHSAYTDYTGVEAPWSITGRDLTPKNKDKKNKKDKGTDPIYNNILRYAPIVGSALATTLDAFGVTNKPIRSNIVKPFTQVAFTPVGKKIPFIPFDTRYALNENTALTNRLINQALNTSNPNRYANMLAAYAQATNDRGKIFRQAQEYNRDALLKTTELNNSVDRFNAEGAFKAATANQAGLADWYRNKLGEEQFVDKTNRVAEQDRITNLSNFFKSIGDLGADTVTLQELRDAIKTGNLLSAKRSKKKTSEEED